METLYDKVAEATLKSGGMTAQIMETLYDKVAEAILKSGGKTAHSWRHFMTRWLKLF